MKHLKWLFPFAIVLFFALPLRGQVTTSSITGTIKTADGQPLTGATIKAVHTPSGTVYGTISQTDGHFTIPGMRVGGPYQLTISYVSYATRTYDNIYLALGTPQKLAVILKSSASQLNEVEVVYDKNAVISPEHTGTATNISNRELSHLPTINRSIADFARLTPQAVAYSSSSDGSSMGISFAGQNNRYNQFTIDGASANDVFGLAASGTNGGQAGLNPIPLEAIKEVHIVLSPYDVTMSGFTGGGINAVTKSGTNTFHGSAYAYYQNQDFVGKSVSSREKLADFTNATYGLSLGGPIIKNKLFFFINAEKYKLKRPLAFNPAEKGSGSDFDVNTLQNLRDYVKNTYDFDPGDFKDLNNERNSTSLFARIDWNLNEKNKLTIRHSYVSGKDDNLGRGDNSITFSNGGYVFNSTTHSSVIEWTSNFSSRSSNDLRITYNRIRDYRETARFPSVTIRDGGLTYHFGSEQYSGANQLDQDNFTITDNFVLYRGKHTITIGTDNEFFNTKNVFLRNFYGAYQYGSISDFKNNSAPPEEYHISYSTSKDQSDRAPSSVHAVQFSLYGQDEWQASGRFRLTYGLRIDLPVYFNQPSANEKFNNSELARSHNVATDQMPDATPLFSPRAGFNWDINGNGETQLRGGVGLFTGRIPFVWISNQYSNTGVESIKYDVDGADVPAGIRFAYEPGAPHTGAYIPANPASAPSEIDVTDPSFKYPQILRGSLAIDQKLPWWGLIGTLEGSFTKTINNILYKDINLQPSTTSLTLGNTTRPLYSGDRINPDFSNVIMLGNTDKGYAYTFTAQIKKPFSNGWAGSIAYTLNHSYSLNDGTSSQALSNWRYAYNINGLNRLDLTHSNYDMGSRVVGYISKTFKYGIFNTTIGLVYTGRSGLPFSYVYFNDVNGDDAESADLIYIPTNGNQFIPVGDQANQQEAYEDFMKYVNSQEYLREHIGDNTERNGDRLPWENHFDLKIEEGIHFYKTHTLTLSLNIQNVGNLLNKKWGHAYFASHQEVTPVTVENGGVPNPTFSFNPRYGLNNLNGDMRVYNYADFTSRWRMQLGVKYSF